MIERKVTIRAADGGISLHTLREFVVDTADAPEDARIRLDIYPSNPVDAGTNSISVTYEAIE